MFLQEQAKDIIIKNHVKGLTSFLYVPTEAILGRVCKKCNSFCVLSEFTSKEWGRKNKASCHKCKPEENYVDRQSGVERERTSESEGQMTKRGQGDQ